MTESDWLQCPSLYVPNMVLNRKTEHRSKSTYAGLHVSSPYFFLLQKLFKKKKKKKKKTGFVFKLFEFLLLYFVLWLFSQLLSRDLD